MGYRYEPRRRPTETLVDTAGQTETFWTRNVKLITFLTVVGLFLAIFGPWSIFRIRESILEKKALEGRITLEEVVAFSELERDLYFSEFLSYTGDRSDTDYQMLYCMDIDENYILYAAAEKPGGKVTYLQLHRVSTGESVDVLTGDVQAFLGR